MLSHPFERTRALRELSSLALVCAIASSATAASVLESGRWEWPYAVVVGMPAFVTSGAWVVMMQSERRAPLLEVRWGWVLALPLAMAWSSLTCMLILLRQGTVRAFARELLRGTYAVGLWVPALVFVAIVFGIPIAAARNLAQEGLDREERGDQLLGLVAFGVAFVSGLVASGTRSAVWSLHPKAFTDSGRVAFVAWTVGAVACGGAVAVLVSLRHARRTELLVRIRAGEESGYRIERGARGEEVVRVPATATYRNGARDVVFESPDEKVVRPRDKNQAPLSVVVIVAVLLMFAVAILAVVIDGAKSEQCPPGQKMHYGDFDAPRCVVSPF